jgi:hypothetical protein
MRSLSLRQYESFSCLFLLAIGIDLSSVSPLLRSRRRGRRFKSCHPDYFSRIVVLWLFFGVLPGSIAKLSFRYL